MNADRAHVLHERRRREELVEREHGRAASSGGDIQNSGGEES